MSPKHNNKEPEEYQVRLTLTGLMAKRFSVLKKYHAFEHNADVIRLVITDAYEKLEREKKLPQ